MLEKQFKHIVQILSGIPKSRILASAFLLLCVLTFADYLTGHDYGFSFFYLFAALFLTWFVSLSSGIAFSILSIFSWFSIRFLLKPEHSLLAEYLILTGEAGIRLLFLLVNAYILNLLKKDFEIRAEQNEQLVELGNLRNYFVGMVAHDMRSPLSIIEMSSAVLLDDDNRKSLNSDQISLIETIYKKSLYMMKLTEDYLDIAKIEAGYLEINKSFFDYSAFIEEIVELNEILAHKKDLHIEVEKTGNILWISFDRNKISQVVNNLLINAIHYSTPGSIIKVSIGHEKDNIVTEFVDSGPGIDAEDMSRLFEIFYRSRKRSEKGTGLGLAISKKIIEAHNGDIGFRNNSEAGSTFWFSLPVT